MREKRWKWKSVEHAFFSQFLIGKWCVYLCAQSSIKRVRFCGFRKSQVVSAFMSPEVSLPICSSGLLPTWCLKTTTDEIKPAWRSSTSLKPRRQQRTKPLDLCVCLKGIRGGVAGRGGGANVHIFKVNDTDGGGGQTVPAVRRCVLAVLLTPVQPWKPLKHSGRASKTPVVQTHQFVFSAISSRDKHTTPALQLSHCCLAI